MKNNWQKVPLSELTEDDSPITYGVVKPGGYGDVVFVRGGDISQGFILLDQLRTITKEVSEQYRRTLLRGGELLICLVGQPGQVAVAPPELAGANIARQVGLIRLHKNVNAEYVRYFLQSKNGQDALGAYTGGSVQQVINLGDLRTVEIPIPPLPEQQRIVSVLDEAFASIAQANSNAERNLVNARELLASLLIKVFLEGINNKKWALEKLEKYNKVVVGYVGPISNDYTNDDDGILLLSTKNISGDGINLEKLTRINRQFHNKNKKSQLVPGDILVARHGNSGQAAVIPDSIKEAHALNVIVIKNSSTLSSEYLAFLLNSGVLDKISSSKGGSVQAIINTSVIKDLIIPVPPLAEQRAIVGRLEALSAETGRLEDIYQQKVESLEELKKSVLAKAFEGEL